MKFKNYLVTNKNGLVVGAAVLFSFTFGISSAFLYIQRDQSQYNITPIKLYNQSKQAVVDKNCPVKGKASVSGRIYHLPGDSAYSRLSATDCFNSESEALAAGFRKSLR